MQQPGDPKVQKERVTKRVELFREKWPSPLDLRVGGGVMGQRVVVGGVLVVGGGVVCQSSKIVQIGTEGFRENLVTRSTLKC